MAKPQLTLAMPETLPMAFGYPLLMVLHGNNSNAAATAPHWASMADNGWMVAVPQSTEVGTKPDGYTWNDRERVAEELTQHFERVKRAADVDASRIVLAGFSMGATQAIAMALTRRFIVRGVIAVAPWLPHIREFAGLVEDGAGKALRTYLLVGDGDGSVHGSRDLVDVMRRHQLHAELDERAGLGHEYPDDMDQTLRKALAFITT